MFITDEKHHKTQFLQIWVVMKNQYVYLSLIRSATVAWLGFLKELSFFDIIWQSVE